MRRNRPFDWLTPALAVVCLTLAILTGCGNREASRQAADSTAPTGNEADRTDGVSNTMHPPSSAPGRQAMEAPGDAWGGLPAGRTGNAGGEDAVAMSERLSGSLARPDSAPEATAADNTTLESKDEGEKSGEPQKPAETWKPAQTVPNSSRLTVGDDDELPFKGQQISVRVDGFRARVVLDMFYENDRQQQLEGTFQIRLPEGASLYYLAFGETEFEARPTPVPAEAFLKLDDNLSRGLSPDDITALRQQSWNEPKIARVVPKEKAAHAYRETVRRRVDPALAEWAGAGVFSARVFPLTPGKVHRIVIGYDVNLLPVGNEHVYRLDFPKAQTTVVDINVADFTRGDEAISVQPAPARDIRRDRRQLFHFENPDEQSVVVRVPAENIWLTGTDADAGNFFAAEVIPDFRKPSGGTPGAAVAESPRADTPAGPSHVVFLLDTSLSSGPNRFPVWLKLLEANLNENRDVVTHFNVACFNIEAWWYQPGWVENTPENVAALLDYCDNLALEGATDLGRALSLATNGPAGDAKNPPPFDLFLLGDGAGTWGEADLYALSRKLGGRRLYAYTTGMAGTDVQTLTHLTRESGGAVFAVTGPDQITAAARAHRRRPWEIQSVEIDGISDVLLAGRPTVLFPGQKLSVVGRGKLADNARLWLTVRQDGVVKTLQIEPANVLDSELTPRVYGQIAVNQLEGFEAATEEFSAAYARHFRVPGQTCSLLMLDSEEDYERYNIKPENDIVVVMEQPVRSIVDDVLEEFAEQLGDPKTAFLNWLAKLEKMPGVQFEQSAALKLVLEKLPTDSFRVSPAPLECRSRTWDGIPGPLQEQLPTQQLDYDMLAAEASRRAKSLGPADALRAMSSLVEIHPGDPVVARDVGFSAMEYGLGAEACSLFRRVAVNRPWEPQTYHAMARCLEDLGNADLAVAWYEVALGSRWDERFGAFKQIVSMDYLRLLRRIERKELASNVPDVFLTTTSRRLADSDAGGSHDLVVTMMWNTDGTDVDLHVVEPTGEVCYYSHPQTAIGGKLTQDVTQGYGPEMYRLTKAKSGEYQVKAHYYANDNVRTGTRTRVYATVYRNWGRPGETVTRTALTLKGNKEEHNIARVKIAGSGR